MEQVEQIKFAKDSPQKIWTEMVCLNSSIFSNILKIVFHKFYMVHFWLHCSIYIFFFSIFSYSQRWQIW